MSIRLNKVTRDLNVGMTTLVDFLQKKGHVVENNPNTKISEEEYEMLVKEYSKDMTLKQEAERLVHERINRDRPKTDAPASVHPIATEHVPTPAPTPVPTPAPVEEEKPVAVKKEEEIYEPHPHIKTIGHIDLDQFKPKPKQTPEPVIEKPKPVEPKVVKEPVKVVVVEPVKPIVVEVPEPVKPVIVPEKPKEKAPEVKL